ncbi:TIGR02587 family membrane protein [Brevundimonas sp. NPDC058933]|uniref:TIGR02587 family membrane protein n=1 Tax=Brevundimonas sp. NPDC058933 TaxID=3346673 RepID=UPI003BEED63A
MRAPATDKRTGDAAYLRDLGRAFGGALLFCLPLMMTMEMWALGHAAAPERLLVFVLAALPLLYGLAHYAGFSARRGLLNNALDTWVALGVGFVTAGGLLFLFNVLDRSSLAAATGQVSLQAIPAALGALVARRQLSADTGDGDEEQVSYPGELFLMLAGALYFAMNLAPTEEMRLIAYRATPLGTLGLLILSVSLLHLIVFEAGFAGQEKQETPLRAFLDFTLPGYAICLAASVAMLWVFGGLDGHGVHSLVSNIVVLAFPAALGAAAARLLV